MELPPGHVSVYRKTIDLLLEAESPEQAQAELDEMVGLWQSWDGPPYREAPMLGGFTRVYGTYYDFFFEEVQGCAPADPPPYREGDHLPYYAATATVAVSAETFSSTAPEEVEAAVESAFSLLDRELVSDDDLALDQRSGDRPAERGTMPSPPPFAEFSISPRARAFIRDRGGSSVYVYLSPLRSLFLPAGPLLTASVDPLPPLEFELRADHEGIRVFVDATIHAARLDIDLRTFPRRMLMSPRTRLTAEFARPSWGKDLPE